MRLLTVLLILSLPLLYGCHLLETADGRQKVYKATEDTGQVLQDVGMGLSYLPLPGAALLGGLLGALGGGLRGWARSKRAEEAMRVLVAADAIDKPKAHQVASEQPKKVAKVIEKALPHEAR